MTTKNAGGRPPLPPGQARTKTLLVRLTPSEHLILQRLSRRLDRPIGEILRTDGLAKAKRLSIR